LLCALVTGLTLVVIAVVVTLSGSPLIVAQTNGIRSENLLGEASGNLEACQAGETLPAGITGIRLSLDSIAGPRVSVSVRSAGHLLTSGVAESGWTSSAVTVPVRSVGRAVPHARICFRLGASVEDVGVYGAITHASVSARGGKGEVLPGRFTVEYMKPGMKAWLASWKTVARHLGLGHAPSGTWIAVLIAALMGAISIAASWLVLKELR